VWVYLSSDYPRQDPDVVKQEFLGHLKHIHQQYLEFLQRSEGQELGHDDESGDDELDSADKMRPMASRQSSAPAKCQQHRKRAMTVKANCLLNDSSIDSVASFINADLPLFDHASPWGTFFQYSNSCLVVG
jgi:hypothetical protein